MSVSHTPLVTTMDDLKSYITGGKGRQVAEGLVILDIAHNLLKAKYAEIKFELDWSISRVKDKVYQMTGSKPEYMVLTLNGVPLSNEDATFSSYGPTNGMLLYCNDTDPYSTAKGGALEDVRLVEKYVMTDEDYDKRADTYRSFKKKMLAQDPNWKPKHVIEEQKKKAAERAQYAVEGLEEETEEQIAARMKVGDRCEAVGGRRGEIMYIGLIPEIPQEEVMWIGVKYDECEGKNNGTVGGKRYFEAEEKQGAFLRSGLVKAGDYPEVDPFASDNDDEDVMEEL